MSRRERMDQMGDRAKKFTNVYVKNFAEALDDDKLKDLFDPYGKIVSCKVMRDENGNSRGFGFVSFEEHEAAVKVCCFTFLKVCIFIIKCWIVIKL